LPASKVGIQVFYKAVDNETLRGYGRDNMSIHVENESAIENVYKICEFYKSTIYKNT
jgi:hypothetical protein